LKYVLSHNATFYFRAGASDGLMGMVSCDFGDLNENPNAPTDASLPSIMAAAGVVNLTASPIGFYYNRPQSPVNLITFVEVKFIEAEAALRAGNRQRAADAYNGSLRFGG
jgi:hypothetical protein